MNTKGKTYESYVNEDWQYLKKIKANKITEHICDIAFNKSHEAIKYIPNKYKYKYSKDAIKHDWNLYNYCNVESLNLDDWYYILNNITLSYEELKKNEKALIEKMAIYLIDKYKDNKINEFFDKMFGSEILNKEYSDNTFKVEKRLSMIFKRVIYEFDTFDEFYNFLNGDLSNSNLYNYDFKGIDLKKYKIDNVAVNSDILIQNGLYNDSFYKDTILPLIKHNGELVKNNDLNVPILHENDIIPYQSGDFMKRASVYYISDIHLDEKISKRFKSHATKEEVEYYIKSIVDQMVNSIASEVITKFVIIAGDVSSSFKIAKMFYENLTERKRISSKGIICILGNHELWNIDSATENKVSSIIELYRNMFKELNITFLQNELLVVNPEIEIISEAELETISEEELKRKTIDSQLTIFGGIGFSGYNPDFNASKLIYFDTIQSLEEDIKLTNKFNSLYRKLKSCLCNRKIIILTHNPKQDWSKDTYNPNWIYINGHTHRNIYEKNQNKQLYTDNQIGYYNENISLKRIDYSLKCNIFADYEDGIHKITLDQYLHFYRKMGYSISCKLSGEFNLLKKNNLYMFVYKNDKGNLYIINGGKNNKLDKSDINYYYNNMDNYSIIIKEGTSSFYDYINQLSDYIKSIGGSGNVHGTIIDIDYYNHVYVNIYDGTITPYWADSMTYKIVYSSVQELLSIHCPKLLKNIETNNKNEIMVMKNELIPKGGEFYEDTRIYKESRIMKRIQYLIDDNIIRIWNDNLLEEKEIKLLLES